MLNEGGPTLLVIFVRVRQELHGLLQGDVQHAGGAVHPAVTQTKTLENVREQLQKLHRFTLAQRID